MSVQRDLDELNNINIEIRRLREALKNFRKQKEAIEARVISFLKEQETHGVRYNDHAVLLESKSIRNKKRKMDKLDDISQVLRKHGIQKNEALLNEILEAQRGEPARNDVLRIMRRS
jgi:hypothetical protein